jgi:hypothetical protein
MSETADFFSEKDCDCTSYMKMVSSHPQSPSTQTADCISLFKVNRLLRERAQVVYFNEEKDRSKEKICSSDKMDDYDTHQALLVCITPIARDTPESLLNEILFDRYEKALIGPNEWAEFQRRARALKERK